MNTINISKVDSLPEISRVGRKSESLMKIIEALNESVKTGAPFRLDGVKAGNAYNSMQQRIRAQAKNLNLKVVVRFDAANEALYFQASKQGQAKSTVKAEGAVAPQAKVKNK